MRRRLLDLIPHLTTFASRHRRQGIYAFRKAAATTKLQNHLKRRRLISRSDSLPTVGSSSSVHSSFQYDRLNWATNEIRLIEILPQDKQSEDGAVACTITSISLDEKPRYVGLSYAWEGTATTSPLVLNGKSFHITTSLDAALRQIRSLQATTGDFRSQRFWVDALCINQSDQVEKSWQVQQMNRIFQNAQFALVWLGPSSQASKAAMDALERVGIVLDSPQELFDDPTQRTYDLLMKLYHDFSSTIQNLLTRSWWKRIWVVQEFALATDVVFLCGDTRLSWSSCQAALEALSSFDAALTGTAKGSELHGQPFQNLQTHRFSRILRLFKIRQELKQQRPLALWDLLTLKGVGMQATDDRDFIYALTGISSDATVKHLYPDYTKHAVQVFTDVARSFLAEGQLRTLWLCSQPRELAGLPSWVPDWSSSWRTGRQYLSANPNHGTGDRLFSAAGDSKPDVSFSSTGSRMILHLQGFAFDKVGATKAAFEPKISSHKRTLLKVHLMLARHFRALWDLDHNLDAVLRTGTTDIERRWIPERNLYYCRSSRQMRRDLHYMLLESLNTINPEHTPKLAVSRYDLLDRHAGRRPFITSQGHLGLGPANMDTDDVVVVVYGSEVPLVLRPVGKGHYELIGEAYVDRIMDGEVLRMHLPETTFNVV